MSLRPYWEDFQVSKVRPKSIEQAINQAVALRRKLVDCRLPRDKESTLLDKATELLNLIEQEETVTEEATDGA
jgi:hypothetical protein